jgi:two-component system, OmpR family, phosphate regulon sensor histidine kinase PhoR
MKKARSYFHPIFIFIISTIALAISLFLYIYWYVGVSAGLQYVVQRYHLDANQFFEARTWVVILVLSLLVGFILAGILIIFIYNLRTIHNYRLQHTFINNFTHELKTPVTSLKLYLETFLRHELTREEQLKYIGFMLQDTERLSNNINSILNLARIESKMYEGEALPLDLVELVENFLASNRHIFQNCEINIKKTFDGPIYYPFIASLFEMLLMNLLTNAMKYNISGKPRIDIIFEKEKKHLLIRFEDNGIGIRKGENKKIFKIFYQGRHHESIPLGGSGIGLYLVHQIVRLHHGKIDVVSAGENKGAVFSLRLPYKTGDEIK